MALFALFVWVVDSRGRSLRIFRVLGQNALVAYLLHHIVEHSLTPLFPKDSPLWLCLLGLGIFLTVNVLMMEYLDRQKLHLKL